MLDSLTLNGLQLLGGTGYTVQQPLDGLDAPQARITTVDRAGEDGARITAALYGSRIITIQGSIRATTAADFETYRKALIASCALQRDANGYPIPLTLEFTTNAGASYFCNVIPQQPQVSITYPTLANYMLTLVVADHRVYLNGQQTSGQVSTPQGGGFLYPAIYPVTLGGSSGGNVTLANSGNIETPPTLTLHGTLTNPYILNETTGEWMQLTATLGASDVVVIDMNEKTITLNGTSLLSAKVSGSSWWDLNPGDNLISLSSGSTSDNGWLEVTWYNAVLGV